MKKTEKPKVKNSSKLKTMIFSIMVAIAVWLVAVYVDDPSITVTANGVVVKLVNEDALSEKGLVIKNKEKLPTFSVRVNGKRSSLMNYMGRITADFNVENIDSAGEYTIEGTVTLPSASLTLAKKPNTSVTIEVANVSEKTVKIYASQTGTNRDLLIKSTPVITETTINGAQDEVDKIAYAAVSVDISNATDDYTSHGDIFFCDADGNKLTDVTSVVAENKTSKVENKIYKKAAVEVKAKLSEELSKNYVLDESNTAITPEKIEVGVLDAADIKDVTVTIDKNLPGEQVLRATTDAENVYIPYANSEIVIVAKMQKITEKMMELEVTDINISEGLKAEYDKTVFADIKCGEDTQSQDVSAVMDLKGLAEGEHYVRVQIKGDDIISAEEVYMMVKITK